MQQTLNQRLSADGIVGRHTAAALAAGRVQGHEPAAAVPKGPPLNDASHPDHALHNAVRSKLPSVFSEEAAANITLHAKQNGIDPADKLQSITVQDGKAFVMGTTPGFRTSVDLAQAPPSLDRPVPSCWQIRCTSSRCMRSSSGSRWAVAEACVAGSGR
ncbi:hypothetical protein BN1263280034 [Stenotrophomonas thermophila]|nr:hypothetical protein BN1263280034 [Stenotrophomonas maltophilia]